MDIVRFAGRSIVRRFTALYDILRFGYLSASSVLLRFNVGRKATWRVFLKQVYFTGFEAIPIISWIALILGLVTVTELLSILPKLGGERLIGTVLVWVIVREAGPVFASVIVIARSGTAVAAELGSMRVSGELTALEAMGIDPMHYLVMPRVIGMALSVLILTFYFEVISVFGGYLLAGFGKSITLYAYLMSITEAMGFIEVCVSLLKSAVFGLIIGSACCRHGLLVSRSITQIPQETTKAVISSLGLVFVLDAFITFIFFMR